jgi:hypothetical protein
MKYLDVRTQIAATHAAYEASKVLGTRTWMLPVVGDNGKNARIVWELVVDTIHTDAIVLRSSLHMDDYVGPVDVMRLRPDQLVAFAAMRDAYESWMRGELDELAPDDARL